MRSPEADGEPLLLAIDAAMPMPHVPTTRHPSIFKISNIMTHIIGRDYNIPSRTKTNHILLCHRSDVIRSEATPATHPEPTSAGGQSGKAPNYTDKATQF